MSPAPQSRSRSSQGSGRGTGGGGGRARRGRPRGPSGPGGGQTRAGRRRCPVRRGRRRQDHLCPGRRPGFRRSRAGDEPHLPVRPRLRGRGRRPARHRQPPGPVPAGGYRGTGRARDRRLPGARRCDVYRVGEPRPRGHKRADGGPPRPRGTREPPGSHPRPRRGAVVGVLILALDASTAVTTVALARTEADGRRVLAEISVPSVRPSGGASEALLPAVHDALSLAGEDLSSVERVLCGVGPGTFTGIRIAAATARALALGSGAALARNSTLQALAAPALACQPGVLAVVDARRGEVFVQRFSPEGPTTGILCAPPGDLSFAGGPLLVGDGAVRYRRVLGHLGHIPPDDAPLNRVSAVGHVMAADLSPGPAEELGPLYVREPDAEVRRDLNPWGRP